MSLIKPGKPPKKIIEEPLRDLSPGINHTFKAIKNHVEENRIKHSPAQRKKSQLCQHVSGGQE